VLTAFRWEDAARRLGEVYQEAIDADRGL
jgi:hypothetical protein